MLDLRTLALGVGVFGATFAIGWWLNIGNLASGVTRSFARPAEQGRVPSAQAPVRPGAQNAAGGHGLVEDRLVREAVIAWSRAYQRPACNQDARSGYVDAASKYAEALMRAAGCNNLPRCPISAGQLERVWVANRSALDRPVALAMADAHAAGGLTERSFRGDIGRAVQVIAGRDFAEGPPPECSNGSRRRWNVRFRR